MDDKVLRRAIIDALDREPSIPSARIGVAVENGVATLTGRVGSHAEKAAAEHAVRRMRGVRAVVPAIAVCQTGRKALDYEIARRARIAIAWHACIPDGAVTVQVENGWVTLIGTVEDAYERKEAEAAVRKLDDVVGVTNLIETRASVAPDQVKDTRACSESHTGAIYLPVANDTTAVDSTHASDESSFLKRAAGWLRA